MKKILSILMATVLLAALCVIPSSAVDEKPMRMTGTFIQPWLYAYWSDDRMENEFKAMEEAGIDTLIMGDSAQQHQYDEGFDVAYNTTVPELKNSHSTVNDYTTRLFEYAKRYNIKIYLGLGGEYYWWNTDFSKDSDAQWLSDMCDLDAKIAEDLYNQYNKYGDTFAGYYWVHEMWNFKGWNDDTVLEKYAQNESKCLNTLLAAIEKFDKNRSFIFSCFANRQEHATKESMTKYYTRFFELTKFRSQDAMAPIDNIGGTGQTLESLDEWTKAYYDAFQASGTKLQFWSNCETYVSPNADPAPISRFAEQMRITSKYCSKLISFTWNHYYSPYLVDSGFNKSLLHYEETGEVENTPPTLPTTVSVSGKAHATISTSGFTDDYGINKYRFYKVVEGEEILMNETSGRRLSSNFNSRPTKGQVNYYILEAEDCTGNTSRVYIPVNGDDASDDTGLQTGYNRYLTEDEYKKVINGETIVPDEKPESKPSDVSSDSVSSENPSSNSSNNASSNSSKTNNTTGTATDVNGNQKSPKTANFGLANLSANHNAKAVVAAVVVFSILVGGVAYFVIKTKKTKIKCSK